MAETDTYTEEQLAAFMTKNGFRQRGMDMTRLETFTDAAFAFAVTLLVVGGGDSVPMNFGEMTTALKQSKSVTDNVRSGRRTRVDAEEDS